MSASSELHSRNGQTRSPQAGVDSAEIAHLMMPMAQDVERFGVSVCGYPAEHLTLVPNVEWASVLPERRCPSCPDPTPTRGQAQLT